MADKSIEKAPEAAKTDTTADDTPPVVDPIPPTASGIQPPTVSHWTDPNHEDEFDDDRDSTLGSDAGSSTASLSASILEYRELHGRRYHSEQGETEYWAPNDERQNESMDISHHVYTLILDDKLYLAPVPEKVSKVLDIGTGTGIWAIDFADQHPEAEVIGTDLSPTQSSWVPPNCRFEVDDATLPWTFQPNTFDFIHVRSLIGSVSDWNALFKEAFQAAKPGGWVESFETTIDFKSDNNSVVPGMALYDWGPLFYEAGQKMGKAIDIVAKRLVLDAFKASGFTNITTKRIKLPVTGYAADEKLRQIGIYNHLAAEQGLEGYALFMLTQIMGWEPAQVHLLVARARKELRSKKVHPYVEVEVIYGQKPDSG